MEQIIFIIIYCLIGSVILFGLAFHDKLVDGKRRVRLRRHSFTVIEGGKRKLRRRAG